jgi:hypothetical protein
MAIDHDKLTDFLHKFVADLGATMAAGNVLVGPLRAFPGGAAQTHATRALRTPRFTPSDMSRFRTTHCQGRHGYIRWRCRRSG